MGRRVSFRGIVCCLDAANEMRRRGSFGDTHAGKFRVLLKHALEAEFHLSRGMDVVPVVLWSTFSGHGSRVISVTLN